MADIESGRIVREYRTTHSAGPAEVFPLLCPIREYDWIPQWRCDLIFSRSGFAECGCVFRTDFGDQWGPEVWVVCDYRPAEKIAFVRTGAWRTTRYEILLAEDKDGTTLTWRQELTGLNDEGERLLAATSDEEFRAMMKSLNAMLSHYLKTGGGMASTTAAGNGPAKTDR